MNLNQLNTLYKGFKDFLCTLFLRRSLIYEMAKRDVISQFSGSFIGYAWALLNPMAMIFILWLVFSVGLKVAPQNNVPFVIWLTAAIAIWNTFVEVINSSTSVLITNSHLVKKVLFPLSILPVVKLISALLTHIIFISLLLVLIIVHKMPFSLCWFQAIYYFFAMSVLAIGIGWLTSAINVFARDTAQAVNIFITFGFYLTPIIWDLQIMPQRLKFFFKLNPLYYIIQGYRESFIYFVPFWHHWQLTIYFWALTLLILCIGAIVFLKLRPHFADLL